MKKLLLSISLVAATALSVSADVVIDGKTYVADTLVHRQVGPGVKYSVIRIPEIPINSYLLETDLTNPYIRAEGVQGNDTLGYVERLDANAKRMRERGLKPVGGQNGNFWCWPLSNETDKSYMFQSPYGASLRNGVTYVNTNEIVNVWQGADYSAVAGVDENGKAFIGDLYWSGVVKGDKIEDQTLVCINRRNLPDQIVLWNEGFGRVREFENDWLSHSERGANNTDNYFLRFVPGNSWTTNTDLHFTVEKIAKGQDRLILGNFDACLGATGNKKAALEALQEGDEIVINSGWHKMSTGEKPVLVQAIEGNGLVMRGGELTDRNTVDSYNASVYSRNCIGTNADGTKLYMFVIDMSSHPIYGASVGATTSRMCQLLKNFCPDVTDVSNLDAGGSAQMMVDYKIQNKTTEASPRAVNNGMFVMSIAPDDDQIAAIAFDDHRIEMPIYSSYTPVILGYNKYGELINQDLKDVTFEIPEDLGFAEDGTITASGNAKAGVIKAHYGDAEAKVIMVNLPAEIAMDYSPAILIDNRTADIPVSATVNGEKYYYNPVYLDWVIDDSSVATIADGKLTGVKNGTTKLTCSVSDFVNVADVTVEISDKEYATFDWQGWKLASSGAKNPVLSEDGVVSYNFSSARTPYLSLSKALNIYSLPDTLGLVFNCSQPVLKVRLDVTGNSGKAQQVINPEGDVFEANKDYRIKFDFSAIGAVDNINTYPIKLSCIYFYLGTADSGSYTMNLKSLYVHYPYFEAGVQNVENDGDNVTISAENGTIDVRGANSVKIYDISGRIISDKSSANVSNGIYVIVADGKGYKTIVK